MAITSLDGYIGSRKIYSQFFKTASLTTVAGGWARAFAQAGNPGAGTLSAGNTANGVVPNSTTAGYIVMPTSFNATGYVSRMSVNSSVACSMTLVDVLFAAGAYAYNANAALSSQPSYSARVPDGDYLNTEIWIEAVTAFTGNATIAATYVNETGGTGRTTSYASGIAPILGRMFKLPLATGDKGVQRIDGIACTVSSAGTFNVLIVRPLCTVSVPVAYYGQNIDLLRTGLPQIYATSALGFIIQTVSTATGAPAVFLEFADA